eukprot:TRINITY_DN44373_c0_g1_i1.p1 TRINITY_DN44373_c0_g1~~TRINITY_DN44373_c0_g1_i1.p1  ORF type:complete len:461 (-),score=24.41 TRINITY_DN44373_c0_g1_i1:315-1697(-)
MTLEHPTDIKHTQDTSSSTSTTQSQPALKKQQPKQAWRPRCRNRFVPPPPMYRVYFTPSNERFESREEYEDRTKTKRRTFQSVCVKAAFNEEQALSIDQDDPPPRVIKVEKVQRSASMEEMDLQSPLSPRDPTPVRRQSLDSLCNISRFALNLKEVDESSLFAKKRSAKLKAIAAHPPPSQDSPLICAKATTTRLTIIADEGPHSAPVSPNLSPTSPATGTSALATHSCPTTPINCPHQQHNINFNTFRTACVQQVTTHVQIRNTDSTATHLRTRTPSPPPLRQSPPCGMLATPNFSEPLVVVHPTDGKASPITPPTPFSTTTHPHGVPSPPATCGGPSLTLTPTQLAHLNANYGSGPKDVTNSGSSFHASCSTNSCASIATLASSAYSYGHKDPGSPSSSASSESGSPLHKPLLQFNGLEEDNSPAVIPTHISPPSAPLVSTTSAPSSRGSNTQPPILC